MSEQNKLYRYEISYKSYEDETDVYCREIPIIKETDCFYFIAPIKPVAGDKPKRVSKSSMRAYAYSTKQEAKEHFIRRTNRRIDWYEFWIKECQKGLEIIESKK
jgi:hypothetical protein